MEGKHHPPRSDSFIYRDGLLGGGAVIHLNRLENLWVDRIIYTHHWRSLLKDLYEEWTMAVGAVRNLSFLVVVCLPAAISTMRVLGRCDVGVSHKIFA